MRAKIKICHVIGDFVNGGVESVIYNYFSHMDLEQFEVHMIGHGIRVQECADRFAGMGFHIHNITPKRVSFLRNMREMYGIFKNVRFDVVHSHLTEWACVPMFLAWLLGVKTRINHSHMAEKPTGLANRMYYGIRLFFGRLFATDYFACGKDAGIYLFGKKLTESGRVTILPNAIDTEAFRYNPERRRELRKAYGIADSTVVVGHVGRFFEQKNHRFLIGVFREYHRRNPDSLLILLGDGELRSEMEKQAADLPVRFLGVRQDVADWYQAMDILVMPSLYEGFPVVGVEAQAAGLPCIFSDAITEEIRISAGAEFFSLENNTVEWASVVSQCVRSFDREKLRIINDYDIRHFAGKLLEFYKEKATSAG